MPLTLGTDTFITLEDANDYFSGHLEAALWAGYGSAKQEGALRGAFYRINGSCDYTFEPNAAPEIVKIAQCEWALELSKQAQKATTKLSAVTGLKAGPAELKFATKEDDGFGGINDFIKRMLSKECQCSFTAAEAETGVGADSSYTIRSY